ncbi:MAG: gephyrin-like molybdotransferase Glp [Acidobacteriaceae bacterium]
MRHAAGVRVAGTERVALLDSAGRALAEEVRADRDQPPFDRTTRDGFAVRAAEWSAGRRLRVVGSLRAGEVWAGGSIKTSQAVEIMTGAALPMGANAVAMMEHVEQGNGEVWAAAGRTLRVEENIVRRSSEARRGDVLLTVGTTMRPAEIALAAACGCDELKLRKRPVVAIVATGDELVDVDETPGDSQIRNSNGYALAALVEAAGGQAKRLSIARDTRESLQERIAEGRKSDLMLLSGGVSVGKYDLVEEVLAEFGAEFFFTGVRMQPGRPVVFGRMRRGGRGGAPTHVSGARRGAPSEPEDVWTYFFGLPGNPVSTQVTFHCFVAPMLRAIRGVSVAQCGPRFVQATLEEDAKGKDGLTRILPAILRHDLERPEVRIVESHGSGDLVANARANCYAVLPEGRDCKAEDVISVLLR